MVLKRLALLLSWAVGVGCSEVEPTPLPLRTAEEIAAGALDDIAAALVARDVDAAMQLVAADYLDQGRDRSALRAWLDGLVELSPRRASFSEVSVDDSEAGMAAAYVLTMATCNGAGTEEICTPIYRCRSTHAGRCGHLRSFERRAEGWQIAGDRAPQGLELVLEASGGDVTLTGGVTDPTRSLAQVTASWAGTDTSVSLSPVAGDYWRVPTNTLVPAELYPGHPLPWQLDVELTSPEGTTIASIVVRSLMDHFASDLSPNGEQLGPIELTWVNPSGSFSGAFVEVLREGDLVWRSPRTLDNTMRYGGPTLTPGVPHDYRVIVENLDGHRAAAESTLTLLDDELVSPNITSVTPNTAPRAGGETLVVIGTDFRAGAEVIIGSEQCVTTAVSVTRIQCTSPALEAGLYTVLVVNPSGRTGALIGAVRVLP